MILILIIVGPLCIICIVIIGLITYLPKDQSPKICYQLADPPGPVEADYLDIVTDIENCTTPECLNNVHTRILIFQSCYPDSPPLIAEIWAKYNQKIHSIKTVT
jgi:hypothetical protein